MDDKYLILVVDDNTQNIKFLSTVLRAEGYEVGIALNGVEALEFVQNNLPDLVLLDIMMPELDGYQVCIRLKQDKRIDHIPIIFLTAKVESEDIIKGFEVGGIDYVTKPFVTAELLARVKTHLEIKTLRSLLPICASCKKVRDEKGLWNQIEEYIERHSGSKFSHGLCEECAEDLYGNQRWYKKRKKEGKT